jgi:rhamnosyltransferase
VDRSESGSARSAPRSSTSVCAVLVTYRPDVEALHVAIAAVRPQVAALVIVDNASAGIDEALAGEDVAFLAQVSNVGLAHAQNLGIDWARANGHSHVLVLDQDSVPAPDMVDQLLAALQRLSSTHRVAAVGPRFRDTREHRDAPFIKVAFPMSHKLWCDAANPDVECDFLISSGALIPLAVLDDVGGMDDGLFIDNVDMEWSFRVRARGYSLYGVCAAAMDHRLGDSRQRVLGGAATVVTHGPARLYYIMRNRLTLYRLPQTPRVWIAQDVPRVLVKFLIFTVLVGPRLRNARYMIRGLRDAAARRMGPCPLEAGSE